MTTWTSFSARPNTQQDFSAQRNFNVDTANVDDTTAYTIRNESDYKKERSANIENQESESLESGYAPRYLVKEVSQLLREFFRKVESLFHDVVHGLGLEIQTLAEEIRNTAATGTQREAGLAQAFQQTVATVQEQSSAAQQALTAAQQSAVTTMEEIGASLEKAVKEWKPGEVELHKLIKAPEAFSPGTWQEEKSGFNEL